MRRTTTMTVRVSGALSDALSDFVAANVGEAGAYASVRDLSDTARQDTVGARSLPPPEGGTGARLRGAG